MPQASHHLVQTGRALLLGLLFVGALANPALSDSPLRITRENATAYEKLLPEPVFRRLSAGEYELPLVSVDPQRFHANYTANFWKQSEKNAGKYGIDAETGGLTEARSGKIPKAIFGFPFPKVDTADPLAGPKVMHNYRIRAFQGDANTHTFDLADVQVNGEILRRVKIFLSHKYFIGTTGKAPAELPDNTEWRQIAAALEPKDVEGVGVLTWRFHDWTTWDQVWAYLPNIRRVRRVRSSSRGDRIPGFEVYGDDADCFDGKITYFNWKLLRETEVIGPVGTDSPYAYELKSDGPTKWNLDMPYNNAVYETPGAKGAGWATLRNVFIRRPVWVIEGTPKDSYYEAGKIELYIDRELYNAYYKIGYTRAGEQYQTNFCGTAWGKTADDKFGSPTPVLMTGINEKENRGTPTGRYTRATFDRAMPASDLTPEYLGKLSGAQ